MTRKELAAQYHGNRCNCSQAVVCAFKDKANIDEETAKAISKQYGGGARKYCGSIMGMYAIANIANGHINMDDPAEVTEETKAYLEPLSKAFYEKNGAIFCKELKGAKTGEVLRSCRGCVEDCAEILDAYFKAKEQ